MGLSVEQLIQPLTQAQALEVVLEVLQGLGFELPESWQPGSLARTQAELSGELGVQHTEAAISIARSGFSKLAIGDWLTLLSESHYDQTRNEAVATQGVCRLSAAASAPGLFVLAAGDVVIRHPQTGYTYRSITGGTLEAGGTLDLTFEAETAGANRNVVSGTITELVSDLSGVTVSNPVVADGTWITRLGADRERDAELQERNRTRWATLGNGGVDAAYVYWGRSADPAVKRVAVDAQNPRGAGTIDVIIAGDLGGLPSLVIPVKDYLLGADGIGRAPLEARAYLEVISAEELAVTEGGVVYIDAAYKDSASKIDEIEAALGELYTTTPIGGTKLSSSSSTGYVLLATRLRTVTSILGVINWAPSITTNIALTARQVPALTLGLTYQYL
jgi:uncharacterized phage protein gp47/JayE